MNAPRTLLTVIGATAVAFAVAIGAASSTLETTPVAVASLDVRPAASLDAGTVVAREAQTAKVLWSPSGEEDCLVAL